MAGQQDRPNYSDRPKSDAKVRHLQRRMWGAAKRSPERRFQALYDRIHRGTAWERVRRNRGAGRVDGPTLSDVEQYGEDRFLAKIQADLRAKKYRPQAVKLRYFEKSGGGRRPLGIPTVRDRVVQAAAKIVLEAISEADFLPYYFGFRPKRNGTQALETLRKRAYRDQDGNYVLDADIRGHFDAIVHDRLMEEVGKRISDRRRRVLKLLRQWLEAGVLEDGEDRARTMGTHQGGVISPLLANVYLHMLDRRWRDEYAHLGMLVRYADDFVVMCDTQVACLAAEDAVRGILGELHLELHPEKTRRVELTDGKDGFDFLGCHLHKRMSGRIWERYGRRRYYLQRWPSAKAMLPRPAQGTPLNGWRDKPAAPTALQGPRSLPTGWNGQVSGGRVMQPLERSPASRMQENRTSGSKEVLSDAANPAKAKYQWLPHAPTTILLSANEKPRFGDVVFGELLPVEEGETDDS